MSFLALILEKFKYSSILFLVVILLQVIIGKPRWQLYPVYFFSIIWAILFTLNYFKVMNLSSGKLKWLLGLGIIIIAISALLFIIFPKEKLPTPSGEFKLGTRIYDFEDPSRDEFYTPEENDKRKIKYQVWYPAENTKGYKKTKWIAEGLVVTRQLAKSMHLPPFMLDHTTQIDSNSFLNAPFSTAQESYPVVVISHGWSGFRALHTDYAEELASNGFIAVSIDHTYGSQAVEFVDGQVAYINKNALSNRNRPSKYANASTLLATTYGKDVASVLDDLERKNTKDENFKGKLKMDTIGVLGHSTGGGGDVFISLKDKRVKALLGFDAWVEPLDPQQLKEGLKIPALFLRSEEWSVGPNNTSLKSLIKNSDNATLIQMNKTKHIDFSMSYMYSPITKYIGFTGQLRGRVSSDVQREYILHFFNHTLKQKDDHASGYLDEITKKYDFLKLVDLD